MRRGIPPLLRRVNARSWAFLPEPWPPRTPREVAFLFGGDVLGRLQRLSGQGAGDGRDHSSGLLEPRSRRAQVRTEIRSEEHTSELQSLMRTSYAVLCLKK